jgi:hypothetical protein
MGKGGNAPSATADTRKTLVTERDEKIAKAPQFYWASGDAMEEPHVQRYVLLLLPLDLCSSTFNCVLAIDASIINAVVSVFLLSCFELINRMHLMGIIMLLVSTCDQPSGSKKSSKKAPTEIRDTFSDLFSYNIHARFHIFHLLTISSYPLF